VSGWRKNKQFSLFLLLAASVQLYEPLTISLSSNTANLLCSTYWKPISAFFKKLFEPVIAVFKQVWSWITNLWEKAKNIFNGIKEWVKDSWVGKAFQWAFGGGDDKAKKTQPKIGESVSESIITGAAVQSAMELPRSSIANSTQSSVSVNAPITINASAGMNAEEVARQVSRELNERESAAARRARGVNYD
jgi:hypothetical protein